VWVCWWLELKWTPVRWWLQVQHTCHSEPQCPPCPVLTQKWCHGKHELRSNIPCYVAEISCGLACNKSLHCGIHKCNQTCHKVINNLHFIVGSVIFLCLFKWQLSLFLLKYNIAVNVHNCNFLNEMIFLHIYLLTLIAFTLFAETCNYKLLYVLFWNSV